MDRTLVDEITVDRGYLEYIRSIEAILAVQKNYIDQNGTRHRLNMNLIREVESLIIGNNDECLEFYNIFRRGVLQVFNADINYNRSPTRDISIRHGVANYMNNHMSYGPPAVSPLVISAGDEVVIRSDNIALEYVAECCRWQQFEAGDGLNWFPNLSFLIYFEKAMFRSPYDDFHAFRQQVVILDIVKRGSKNQFGIVELLFELLPDVIEAAESIMRDWMRGRRNQVEIVEV